jgi:uncharacterized protein (DUF1330 family)
MSAYIVVELTLKDPEALGRYRTDVAPTLKRFGGEPLAVRQPWQVLHGEAAYETGTILGFPDREAALACYNSPEYQALGPVRDKAFNSRFRLVG